MPRGGFRLGAGRTPKGQEAERKALREAAKELASMMVGDLIVADATAIGRDPLEFMLETMADARIDVRIRLDAAKSVAPYLHAKVGEAGKKAAKQKAAGQASGGKFAAAAPPKLVVNNR